MSNRFIDGRNNQIVEDLRQEVRSLRDQLERRDTEYKELLSDLCERDELWMAACQIVGHMTPTGDSFYDVSNAERAVMLALKCRSMATYVLKDVKAKEGP